MPQFGAPLLAAKLSAWSLSGPPHKAAENIRKHRVAFNEASTVFGDFFSTTVPDRDHSVAERRYITVGISAGGQPLLVAHTQRGERIRIISARTLTRKERQDYESTS